MKNEVAIKAPSEWRIEPDILQFEIPAGSQKAQSFQIALPKDWSAPSTRFAIAADVRSDGRYLGQITEAVVDMRG
jgi:hypothetical protein